MNGCFWVYSSLANLYFIRFIQKDQNYGATTTITHDLDIMKRHNGCDAKCRPLHITHIFEWLSLRSRLWARKKDLDNLYAIIEHLFVLVFVHYSGHSHIFCESCHQCRDSVTRHNGLHGPKRMCECLQFWFRWHFIVILRTFVFLYYVHSSNV